MARTLARVAGLVLLIPLVYLLLAVAGALIPRNVGWQQPERGIPVFVSSNAVHADLIVPARATGVDWYALLPPAGVPDPASAAGWIAIGWGQRDFYLKTRNWSDLTLGVAAKAMLGGEALLHVEHRSRPGPSASTRPLHLSPDGYRRMARAIARSFVSDGEGRAIPLPGSGYKDDDVFYEARGTYHAFTTSNQWTANRVADAGATIGVWTPFAQSLMWRFDEE